MAEHDEWHEQEVDGDADTMDPVGLLPQMYQEQDEGASQDAAEARMMERLRTVLVGPNRNIFDNDTIKQDLIKPVEVLNRALIGKFNSKHAMNSSDKERVAQIKKDMMRAKNIITAWLLKRQSLLSRFIDTRIDKFVFAKFVLKKEAYFNPTGAEVCATFAAFTELTQPAVQMAIAHFVNLQLAIISGMPEYLQTHRSYVEKMDRINARVNQAATSIANAISIKKLVYNVIMDCLLADYYDFKFDVVIDHDDQMSHYDIQRLNRVLPPNVDENGEHVHNVARQHLDGILDIVGQNGGNREAVMVDILQGEADDWDPNSFVRDLILAARGQNRDNAEVGEIASENDATSLLMHYMKEPKDFDPTKTSTIIQARINKHWYQHIQKARDRDEHSAQLLATLPAPMGLMSYKQALTYIAKRFEGNEKFAAEAAESGLVENVMPFPVIAEYAVLHEHIKDLESKGLQATEEYQVTCAALDMICPPEERPRMEPYIIQYRKTRQNFVNAGVENEQFANPSMLEPGSAVHCFPDNCEDTEDAILISRQVVDYLNMRDSLTRTEEAIKSGENVASGTVEEMTERMVEMVNGPSIDQLHQNDANYFDRHYDAPWVSQVEDDLKKSLFRLAQTQARLLQEEQEQDIKRTMQKVVESGLVRSEADLPKWRAKMELAFQKKPEDYIVEGQIQTLGYDGKTQQITVQYIAPDVQNRVRAAKATIKTPIKWPLIAGTVWKIVSECAQYALIAGGADAETWRDGAAIDKPNLLNAVCQVFQTQYWNRFTCTLLTDLKTSLAAEEKASAAPKNPKKRRRALTPNLVSQDARDEAEHEDLANLQDIAKSGKLVVTSGGSRKKKPTVFVP